MPETIRKEIQLVPSWKTRLEPEFTETYMLDLKRFLLERKKAGAVIYPSGERIFNAFNSTPFEQVKVVILGQDPYHGPRQAHGLSFSVLPGVATPPSLINIFKEMSADLDIQQPGHGYLQSWAEQGVLLLNSTLTVERGNAGSHQKKGWEQFTDQVVRLLNAERESLVFMLWGAYALKKGSVIDRRRHFGLKRTTSIPAIGTPGFFWLPSFLQGE